MNDQRLVLAVLTDLMFRVRIEDAARRAGVAVTFAQTQERALAEAKKQPSLVIFDLDNESGAPTDTIARLRSDPETKDLPLLGYVSHVQTDRIKGAQEAGCNRVMARSSFVQKLHELLAGQD